ncbi:hypothetical protein BDV98DRAFT_97817 [Pterulicium gracile]|uniref:Uncharacterized protein n=1 Tax=Pterulicium gracile TaxID=1884261 RepID=A0A5C3QGK6_9AGAR|nr:hypothetical protein BDV98DRAFT_97817 [Pterula gracilis]
MQWLFGWCLRSAAVKNRVSSTSLSVDWRVSCFRATCTPSLVRTASSTFSCFPVNQLSVNPVQAFKTQGTHSGALPVLGVYCSHRMLSFPRRNSFRVVRIWVEADIQTCATRYSDLSTTLRAYQITPVPSLLRSCPQAAGQDPRPSRFQADGLCISKPSGTLGQLWFTSTNDIWGPGGQPVRKCARNALQRQCDFC